MRFDMPMARRFLSKLVHDVVPAALASLLGGFLLTHSSMIGDFLLTHYGLGRAPEAVAVRAAPASAEMMGLLRDEHTLMVNFLKEKMASEKKQLAAAKEAAPAAAEVANAEPAMTGEAPRQAVALAASKPAVPRTKPPVVGASLPPLVVVAQAPQNETSKPEATRDPDSLFAKTIGIKDHVIAVTQRAVSVIGGIPSWIGSIGDHIGGEDASPRPPANLVSSS